MKTLYISDTGRILLDAENNKCDQFRSDRESIQNIYLIEESMHVVFDSGEYHKELDVEQGDILITFYREGLPHRVIVAKSSEWAENVQWFRDEEQKEKERWAAKQAADGGSCPCDCEM